MFDKSPDPTFVLEDVLLAGTLIKQLDSYAGVQKRQLAEPSCENVVVKCDVRERDAAWAEVDDGAAPGRLPGELQAGRWIAVPVDLPVSTAVAVDGEFKVLGECVDDGDPA